MLRTGLIGICGLGLVLLALPSVALNHADQTAESHSATEFSAKRKRHKQDIYLRRAPQPAYTRHWFKDPSLGADGRPYRNPYPPGTCSTDLGYGRFGNCDSDND